MFVITKFSGIVEVNSSEIFSNGYNKNLYYSQSNNKYYIIIFYIKTRVQ